MEPNTYRDMHILEEVTHKPDVTQRELSKRIGVALGLTNLMLRRLVKKGYIKITGTKRSRLRYLITPQGILEKSRLTYEFVQYSLNLYAWVRHFWREQLSSMEAAGHHRILLYGTGELSEIAFLTIREIGLGLVGIVEEHASNNYFLGYPVKKISDITPDQYDRLIVALLYWEDTDTLRLVELGVPLDRIIALPRAGAKGPSVDGVAASKTAFVEYSIPELTVSAR